MERLDKFLCDCGIGTRSQVKAILKSGAVTVDGIPERDNSRKVDPQKQVIAYNGERLGKTGRIVVMLNKPAGFVTATEDAKEQTVMELLPKEMAHLDLKPVGRLDKATEGLLLFTNDGDLLHRLISPKKEVPRSTMPAMRAAPRKKMWKRFKPALSWRTVQNAFLPGWNLWERERASLPYVKVNTTRCAG